MAKEFILVSRASYEKMMYKDGKHEKPTNKDEQEDNQPNDSTEQVTNQQNSTDATTQTGMGFYVKHSTAEIPGILDQPPKKKKKRNINWMEF